MVEQRSSKLPGLKLSGKARRTGEAPISALMAAALGNPELINLAAGFVDDLTLPVAECGEITRKIFSDPGRGRAALQYGTTLGLRPLREKVLRHLEQMEGRPAASMGLGVEDVIITTGSQQVLYLVGDVLVDPGDIVIAANPSYFVFTGTLQSLGAEVLAAPTDEDGMDVEAVERLLGKLEAEGKLGRVKFIYCTSYFDNPTGLTLSRPRRKRLMEVVRKFSRGHRILVMEDAAYRELRYDGEDLPSIKSFDPENQYTILTHTFSKAFAPGLKLGYTAMPRDVLDAVLQQKGNHDFGSASLCQHIALEAMCDGSYDKHLEVLKGAYRRKRDAMVAALEKEWGRATERRSDGATKGEGTGSKLPVAPERPMFRAGGQECPPAADKNVCPTSSSEVRWTRPHGGLYVWVTLPEGMDASREGAIFKRCVERGVLYVPGDLSFHPDERGRVPKNHIRLSFGQIALEKIDEGIRRLAEVVKEAMQDAKRKTVNGGVARA